VLDALEYAHGRGVIHRDLKPDNIMVIPGGSFSRECVKLLDFGIAKLENDREAKGQKLTQLGLLLGTPGYMSPEQTLGMKADARSDLYSCGVILYEMLTGQRPFEADSSLDLMSMQLNATTQWLETRIAAAGIPAAFEPVVLRALAKRPEERFQSARELRHAVDRAAGVRGGNAGVSGIGKTVLAASCAPRRSPRWIRLATIAAATAMLIGDHIKPPSRHGERVIAGAEDGSPSPARTGHSSPATAAQASERIKRDVRPTRATGKKSPVRKR
jgi:serine/threonine protein kinase